MHKKLSTQPLVDNGDDFRAAPERERVTLWPLQPSDREEFLAMVHSSRDLHQPWAYPPERSEQFIELMARCRQEDHVCLLARHNADDVIVGVFTVSQIVRHALQSAFLGYYANAAYAGQGLMAEAIELTIDYAFGPLLLHRLEANIQPGNDASIALARSAGFRMEGFSPRYLQIGGRWRDHERWAITAEERNAVLRKRQGLREDGY